METYELLRWRALEFWAIKSLNASFILRVRFVERNGDRAKQIRSFVFDSCN
jgi:hypothetical protein